MFNFFEETVARISRGVGYAGEPIVVFLPNRGVYVESKCEILSYDTDCIRFKTKHGILVFSGTNISISCLEKDSFFVNGTILKVEVN